MNYRTDLAPDAIKSLLLHSGISEDKIDEDTMARALEVCTKHSRIEPIEPYMVKCAVCSGMWDGANLYFCPYCLAVLPNHLKDRAT